jgi:hypothetical protein
MPTRNRAHLLPYALRSALEQEFDDFDVVVVANNCTDGTRDVVAGFDDRRIRYHETDRTLSMPDNWDLAWTLAEGQYVVDLPDDDALVPSALRLIAEQIRDGAPPIISWEDAPYYYPGWNDPAMENLLLVFFHGDVPVEDVPMRVYREQCARFTFAWSSPLPKMLNCAANRDMLNAWRARLGRLFFPIAPDYSFAWIVSHVFPSIRVIHRPLNVRGISEASIGSQAGLGAAAREFFREFDDPNLFAGAPIALPVAMTQLTVTFDRVSALLAKEGITTLPLDLERFLLVASQQFRDARDGIQGWADYVPNLLSVAGSISPALREAVEGTLGGPTSSERNTEAIRDVRSRTARMALEYPPNLELTARQYLGDERCARCALGLEPGMLASDGWQCAYVFGEEIGVFDPYAASKVVDGYFDLVMRCRGKRGSG